MWFRRRCASKTFFRLAMKAQTGVSDRCVGAENEAENRSWSGKTLNKLTPEWKFPGHQRPMDQRRRPGKKLKSFSRHAEGKPSDYRIVGSSISDLKGSFRLDHGLITFKKSEFWRSRSIDCPARELSNAG